jgi:anti-sigma regulatory factor (Ser/Thr protein kinase)
VTDIHQDFRSRSASVALARHFVGEVLLRSDAADERIDRSILLVSELATSSVLHATGGFRVRVLADGRVRVEVSDRSPSLPLAPDRTGAPRLGLYLLDALADEWGWEPGPDGKCVWFELL